MPRSKEIPEEMRKRVIYVHQSGKGYKSIAQALGLHRSTVRSIICKWKMHGTVGNLPRSGRPSKISSKVQHKNSQQVRKAGDREAVCASNKGDGNPKISLDCVGCFEGGDESKDSDEDMDERVHGFTKMEQPGQKEVSVEDMMATQQYDPDTLYGSSFVVPVTGFLCRLCHEFYHFESTARHWHCKSFSHFQNLQKYKGRRHQDDDIAADTRRYHRTMESCTNPHKTTPAEEQLEFCTRDTAYAASHRLPSMVNSSVNTVPVLTLLKLEQQEDRHVKVEKAEAEMLKPDAWSFSCSSVGTSHPVPNEETPQDGSEWFLNGEATRREECSALSRLQYMYVENKALKEEQDDNRITDFCWSSCGRPSALSCGEGVQ